MFVADFYRGADRLRWLGDGNPIYILYFERGGAERIVVADDDAIVLRFDGQYVERFAGGEAETFALTDGEIVDAVVAAENFAGFGDDIAIARAERNFVFCRVGVDELHVVAVGHEAQFHAVGLFGDGQSGAASDFANFVLGKFAERKFTARKLFLRKSPEKIRLIF